MEMRVAAIQEQEDWMGWREQVAAFATASGASCLLTHVTESDWRAHFAADADPYDAVLQELYATEH